MVADPFKCPECGSRMLNDLAHGYRCISCGNREPFGHLSNEAGRNAGAAGGTARRGAGSRVARGTGAEGGGTAIARFEPPTLERLARIIGSAYTGSEITDLFGKAGFETIWHDGGTKWRFLYAEFERIQERFGPTGVTKILMTACSLQERLNGRDIRKEVNQCLSFSGMGVNADGEMRQTKRSRASLPGDDVLFDQREYHGLIVEHGRPKFVDADYFGAVVECCKGLEKTVATKSGIDGSGTQLISWALRKDGPLKFSTPRVSGRTQEEAREGLMHLCMGVMQGVRNPASHEYERDLPMPRSDALDILTVLSYVFRQLDQTVRRPAPEDAPGKTEPGQGASTAKRLKSSTGSEGHTPVDRGAAPGASKTRNGEAALAVRPTVVGQGDAFNVAVTGKGIGEWYVSVSSEGGELKSPPTMLEARASPKSLDDGSVRYAFSVKTLGYRYGEYRVSVSKSKDMDARGTRIKNFTVTTNAPPRVAGAGSVHDDTLPPFMG